LKKPENLEKKHFLDMEKDFPEETKTNIFLDEIIKETPLIQDPEEEEIDNETYSSLEEYFLDCCRDGFLMKNPNF